MEESAALSDAELATCKKELAAEKATKWECEKQLIEEQAATKASCDTLKSDRSDMEDRLEKAGQKLKETKQLLEDERALGVGLGNAAGLLEDVIAKLKVESAQYGEKLIAAEALLVDEQRRCSQLVSGMSELQAKLEVGRQELVDSEQPSANKDAPLVEAANLLELRTNEVAATAGSLSKMSDDLKDEVKERQEVETQLAALDSELQKLMPDDTTRELMEVKNKLASIEAELMQANTSHDVQASEAETKHSGALSLLMEGHEAELKKLKRKRTKKVSTLKPDFEGERKQTEKDHMIALVALTDSHNEEMDTLQQQLDDKS